MAEQHAHVVEHLTVYAIEGVSFHLVSAVCSQVLNQQHLLKSRAPMVSFSDATTIYCALTIPY